MEVNPQIFFSKLKTSITESDNQAESFRLLDSFNRILNEEQSDYTFIDLYLPYLFRTDNSLLKFVDTTSNKKCFKKSCEKALEIIYTIINNCYHRIPEKDILSVCSLAARIFYSQTDASIKCKLYDTVLKIVEKNDGCVSLGASQVYKHIIHRVSLAVGQKTADTVKGKEMELLGYMAKTFPYLIEKPQDVRACFLYCFDLYCALIQRKLSQKVLEGFYVGYGYYLESFPINLNLSDDRKRISSLYTNLKFLVVFNPQERVKIGNKAGIRFFANYSWLFKDYLLKDYNYWQEKLMIWVTHTLEYSKIGAAALRSFYQTLSKDLEENNYSNSKEIIKHFINYSRRTLSNENVSNNIEKRLSIFCLRELSPAIHKHLEQQEVTDIFLFIMQTFEKTFIEDYKEDSSEEKEYLPDYLQTVANFVRFKQLSSTDIFCLQKGVVSMVKTFHMLPALHHFLVVDSLLLTLFYLKDTKYFDGFVGNTVYQGVVYACSHQHVSVEAFIDDSLSQKVVTVKNYFPLWQGLLKVVTYKHYDKFEFYLNNRRYILERIVNELVKTLMILINKLNVSLREEDETLTNVGKAFRTEKNDDYAIFLNLVDFYKEIFDHVEPKLLKRCICKMIDHVITKSLEFPLISGFYKLLSYFLKIIKQLDLFDTLEDGKLCKENVASFLLILFNKMGEFTDDLLISCLQVVLETPVSVIETMLPACIAPFINVFDVGRSYLPLAELGVDTLEYWQENMREDLLEPVLGKITPSLDTFLRSKFLRGRSSEPIQKRRKTVQVLKKRKIQEESEAELVKLQRKILRFIGRQSLNNCRQFIFSDSIFVQSTITKRGSRLVKVTLPFEDLQLDVYLDAFLPRIVELALYSSDRKTRITSCELLQACVTVFLGRVKPMSMSGLEDSSETLKILASTLLLLSCDVDQVVRQIFEPLFLQMIHWYTSPTQSRGMHAGVVLEAVLEAITHPTNSNLKDFAGKCVKEYVRWTLKFENLDPTSGIKVLIKNMRFFCNHPDPFKKLGAALIFNNTYTELREEEKLVSIFWLEILHVFVVSLDSVRDVEETSVVTQTKKALAHIQRVIVDKCYLFERSDNDRRIPNDLGEGKLFDVVEWLLKQTASTSFHCRRACMDLYVNMARSKSLRKLKLNEIIDYRLTDLYDVKLMSLKGESCNDCASLFKFLRNFTCVLDGYKFIVTNRLETVSFDGFEDIQTFIERLESSPSSFSSLEKSIFVKLRNVCVTSLLTLFNAVLNDDVCCGNSEKLWTDQTWKFIAKLALQPHDYDLNVETSTKLLLVFIFNSIPGKFPTESGLVSSVEGIIKSYKFSRIRLDKTVPLTQRNLLKGVVLINGTDTGKKMALRKHAIKLLEEFLSDLSVQNQNGTIFINNVQETTINYTIDVIKFTIDDEKAFDSLIKAAHSNLNVHSVDMATRVTFGVYFFTTFADSVVPAVVNNFEKFLRLSLEEGVVKITLELVMFVLNYVVKDDAFKTSFKVMVDNLLAFWNIFVAYFNENEENEAKGIEFVTVLLRLSDYVSLDIQDWLVERLGIAKGSKCIEVFGLVAKVTEYDLTEDRCNALKASLTILNDKISSQSTDLQLVENNFAKLVTLLPTIKSGIIFDYLIELYVTKSTKVEIYNLVAKLMQNLNDKLQELFLQRVYRMVTAPNQTRYVIARDVLTPMFQTCTLEVFESFFVKNIESIVKIFEENELEPCTIAFILVEILFLRIPIGTAERSDCSISKASKKPKLLAVLLDFAFKAFQVPVQGEVVRKYKCHAYNALASIISNSVNKEAFYDKLFARKSKSDNSDLLWHGIIDTTIDYDFPKDFDTIPAQRKILINIRGELRRDKGETNASLRYIESQRLFNSSLSEDVTKYDFTNSSIRAEALDVDKLAKNGMLRKEMYLDGTEINEHECMTTVCGVLQHMFDGNVYAIPVDDDDELTLPSCLEGIRSMLLDNATHKNVKIFLVKVIDNLPEIFAVYAKWFIEPLVRFVLDNAAGATINYFVTDVLVIISRWSTTISNLSSAEARLASNLLEFFIKNLEKDRQDVFKYNLELLKLIVESWKQHLTVPTEVILQMFQSDQRSEIAIYVSSILLVNGLVPWSRGREHEFLDLMLKQLNSKTRQVYRACAETLGPLMCHLKEPEYVEKLNRALYALELEKYVVCLEGIVIKCPQIVDTFHAARLIMSYNQVPTTQKILHWKIINRRVEISLDILQEMSEFKIVSWHEHIEDSNLDLQILTLEIVRKCLEVFVTYADFHKVPEILRRNVNHTNAIFRSSLYDVAIGIYNLKRDTGGACKEILILGLVDADLDNRQKVMDFWMDRSILPSTVVDRFSFLLSELYESKIEDKLLGLCTYFLVGLLNGHSDAKMFEHPLEDCDFEEYKLQTNWKLQHPSVVPMFAETMDFNSIESGSSYVPDGRDVFALRRTQTNYEFTPTQSYQQQQISKYTSVESTLGVDLEPHPFKNPNSILLSQKYKWPKRRFLKDKNKISRMMAHHETHKQIKRERDRKESVMEREKKVTIYRSYRKGDFPDIQIALSALLKPLQVLALQDNEISKILFTEIFKGLAAKIDNNQSFLTTVLDGITNIFKRSVQFNRYLFAALFDILLKNKEKMFVNPKLVSHVALESGLASTGILLIEDYINLDVEDLRGPSSSKRNFREDDKETVYWIKLAELYRELEDLDAVKAIFLEKMDCKESFQTALAYESKSMYKEASNMYNELIRTSESQNKIDFYYDSYFRCFANLGEWEKIPNAVKTVLGGENTWDNLWTDEWAQQKLLPWYLTSQVKNELFNENSSVEFLDELNECLKDSKRVEYLNTHFAEELCGLWLSEKDPQTAKQYLNMCLRNFLEEWYVLNPMFQSQRYQKLLNLQNVIEIADFLNFFEDFIEEVDVKLNRLTERWCGSSNARLPSILLAETKLLYRKQFIDIITDKLTKTEGLDVKEYIEKLNKTKISMDIDLINFAVDQRNFSMVRKYMQPYLDRDHPKLNEAKGSIYVLKADIFEDDANKVKFYLKGAETFDNLVTTSDDVIVKVTSSSKIFDILAIVQDIFDRKTHLFNEFHQQLNTISNDNITSPSDVEQYGWKTFKNMLDSCRNEPMDSGSDISKTVAVAYTKLAQYVIDKRLQQRNADLIMFVLRAMKLDSIEARRLFPCLLMLDDLGGGCKDVFIKEAEEVPIWMFLGWIPQLLANVDSGKLSAISMIIIKIAENYPQAIMYAYRISKEHYRFNEPEVRLTAEPFIKRLDELLLQDDNTNTFLKALSYVSMPASILRYYVHKIRKAVDVDTVEEHLTTLRNDIFCRERGEMDRLRGVSFKKISKFQDRFAKMSRKILSDVKELAEKLDKDLQKLLAVEMNPNLLLKDFSPWLANFSSNKLNVELEVPGQYDGQKMPLCQYHVKIAGFQPEVKMLPSLRKPIKITMLGEDTKEYPFLIKFGEDIRQDERIEQMFGMMNNSLRNDSNCSNSGLDILTYKVIPLTSSLGIIQWINDTIPLENFVYLTAKKERVDKDAIREEYVAFLNFQNKSDITLADIHGEAAKTVKKEKIVSKYMSLVKKIPSDLLRCSFLHQSTSTENYIGLLNNFIKTYATMCASHWLLGIGDRHLTNSLICSKSGKVLGIDFGHAFGTATQILPVPELVPFRLTPQITASMQPLKERGKFREYMVHCLRCLRANSSSLMATMSVFIQEPSMDWLEHVGDDEDRSKEDWYPTVKVNQASRKLRGANPVDIMKEELEANVRLSRYKTVYGKLVEGDEKENIRARLKGLCGLSVEDQVDCLIDHATDYNLLGRMYCGWAPWV